MRIARHSLFRSLLTAAAVALSPLAASAQGFNFFGNFAEGPNAGMFAGSLTLAGFTTGATGVFSASSLTITSYPGGIMTSPEGNVATSWSLQTANSFTTLNGAITGWQFIAGTGASYTGSTYLLCLNTGAFVGLGGRQCPSTLNFVGLGGSTNFAFNFGGAQGLTFESTGVPVPEPATAALLAGGLLALGAAARRTRVA